MSPHERPCRRGGPRCGRGAARLGRARCARGVARGWAPPFPKAASRLRLGRVARGRLPPPLPGRPAGRARLAASVGARGVLLPGAVVRGAHDAARRRLRRRGGEGAPCARHARAVRGGDGVHARGVPAGRRRAQNHAVVVLPALAQGVSLRASGGGRCVHHARQRVHERPVAHARAAPGDHPLGRDAALCARHPRGLALHQRRHAHARCESEPGRVLAPSGHDGGVPVRAAHDGRVERGRRAVDGKRRPRHREPGSAHVLHTYRVSGRRRRARGRGRARFGGGDRVRRSARGGEAA